MPYGLKKMLEIAEERKRKREEKAKLKAEKEKAKKKEKARERYLRKHRKRNRLYRAKKKAELDAYRKSINEEIGYYSIYVMRDGVRRKKMYHTRSKNDAIKKFHELVDENHTATKIKKTLTKTKNRFETHEYELMLIKRISDAEETNVSHFRDDNGKLIEHKIVDSENHRILLKDEWMIEETFNLYGCNPQTDRKTFQFIFDNLVLKNLDEHKRVVVSGDKVVIHYDDDFDIIICKTSSLADNLYNMIEKNLDAKKHSTVHLMGRLTGTNVEWLLDEMQEKTGWTRKKCFNSERK